LVVLVRVDVPGWMCVLRVLEQVCAWEAIAEAGHRGGAHLVDEVLVRWAVRFRAVLYELFRRWTALPVSIRPVILALEAGVLLGSTLELNQVFMQEPWSPVVNGRERRATRVTVQRRRLNQLGVPRPRATGAEMRRLFGAVTGAETELRGRDAEEVRRRALRGYRRPPSRR